MTLLDSAEAMKELYRTFSKDLDLWDEVIAQFEHDLETTNDVAVLEKCVLDDENWELAVSLKLDLLHKAKRLGASSKAFLIQYYGYLAAHLDPSEEKTHADREVRRLMGVD